MLFIRTIVVFVFLGVSTAAYAEVVKCLGATDVAGEAGVTLAIEPRYSPGLGSIPFMTATVKNDAEDLSQRFDVETQVVRKRNNSEVIYLDRFDPSAFELVIQSDQLSGMGLSATLRLDTGGAYERKMTGLVCSITGLAVPAETDCPHNGKSGANAALIQAAQWGSASDIEHALFCGADVSFKDENDCTALLYISNLACGYREPGAGGHLLDSEAPQAPLYSSRSELVLGDMLRALLDAGAKVNDVDPVTGETPLINFAKYASLSGVGLLLEAKANIDAQDAQGNTPLILAAANGNDILVRDLLGARPDLAIKNKEGKTAYAIAQEKGYLELLELLKPIEASAVVQGRADETCTPANWNVSVYVRSSWSSRGSADPW